jgi:hypothetical protein
MGSSRSHVQPTCGAIDPTHFYDDPQGMGKHDRQPFLLPTDDYKKRTYSCLFHLFLALVWTAMQNTKT